MEAGSSDPANTGAPWLENPWLHWGGSSPAFALSPRRLRSGTPRHPGEGRDPGACAASLATLASLWRVLSPRPCPRSAAGNPFRRQPASPDHPIPPDDSLGVATACGCEAACEAGRADERREPGLIRVDAGDRKPGADLLNWRACHIVEDSARHHHQDHAEEPAQRVLVPSEAPRLCRGGSRGLT